MFRIADTSFRTSINVSYILFSRLFLIDLYIEQFSSYSRVGFTDSLHDQSPTLFCINPYRSVVLRQTHY